MTPGQAIRLECQWCIGKRHKCYSLICELSNRAMSMLNRIKAHCLDCVETRQNVKDCTGKLLFEDKICNLHPYRMGKNPKLKHNAKLLL